MLTQEDASRDILLLNRLLEKKLLENGFSKVDQNPDVLIQSVIASIDYEKEVLGLSWNVGLGPNSLFSPSYLESGKYGKVIFLIQDAQTYEVLWMGTGTGILTANELINKGEINAALDRLLANLN